MQGSERLQIACVQVSDHENARASSVHDMFIYNCLTAELQLKLIHYPQFSKHEA